MQLETRDSRIHALEKKVRGFELRPIIVIKRRRMDAILTAWFNLSEERRRRRMRFERAGKHFMNRQLAMAWNSWWGADFSHSHCTHAWRMFHTSLYTISSQSRWFFHTEAKRRGDILNKAAGRMKNIKMYAAWNKW